MNRMVRIGCVACLILSLAQSLTTRAAERSSPDFSVLDAEVSTGALGSINSLIIAQHGDVVFEKYYRGHGPDSLFLLNSATKSLGATLIGILAREGRIRADENFDQALPQYPWIADPRFARNNDLRVSHALSMRLGLVWDEWSLDYRDPDNSVNVMSRQDDWYRYVLRLPKSSPPDRDFLYNSGASNLMSAVIRARSGLTPQAFAESRLFGPLQIQDYHVEGYSDRGRGHGLTRFPYGEAPLGGAWWLRARDMLKLGELHRQGGEYQGQRILDEAWIVAAWTPHSHAGNSAYFRDRPRSGYGYQWWLTEFPDGRGRWWRSAYADGWGRQFIFVFPDLALTVVTTADDYDYEGPGIGHALRTYILDLFDPMLDSRFSGSWFNPDMPGQGLQVEVLEESGQVIAYWFTFDTEGNQQWMVGQGTNDSQKAQLSLYRPIGGRFMGPEEPDLTPAGTATLSFSECDRGVLEYEIEGRAGRYPLQRLTGSCASPLVPRAQIQSGEQGADSGDRVR